MMRWFKFFLVGFALILAVAYLFQRPLLRGLGSLIVYQVDDFDHVDAVLILSGVIPDRALQAADLLRQGRADQAILFREELPGSYETLEKLNIDYPQTYEINQQILQRLGVDPERIHVIPDRVDSTWEEALALRKYLNERPLNSLVITTCQYHSYRAYLNFEKALQGTAVKLYSVPSRYCEFQPYIWWEDRDQIKRLYVEIANLAAFFLGRR